MDKGCDFDSMVEDYDQQHPEEAEEMGLKIYRNDGVIDEMTEGEAYGTAIKRLHSLEGQKQGVVKKKRKC